MYRFHIPGYTILWLFFSLDHFDDVDDYDNEVSRPMNSVPFSYTLEYDFMECLSFNPSDDDDDVDVDDDDDYDNEFLF